MIKICYNKGYKEINNVEFPTLCKILKRKDLSIKPDDENSKGDLINAREISTKYKGRPVFLTELFLKPLEYYSCIQEINAGENPVLIDDITNYMIMLQIKN